MIRTKVAKLTAGHVLTATNLGLVDQGLSGKSFVVFDGDRERAIATVRAGITDNADRLDIAERRFLRTIERRLVADGDDVTTIADEPADEQPAAVVENVDEQPADFDKPRAVTIAGAPGIMIGAPVDEPAAVVEPITVENVDDVTPATEQPTDEQRVACWVRSVDGGVCPETFDNAETLRLHMLAAHEPPRGTFRALGIKVGDTVRLSGGLVGVLENRGSAAWVVPTDGDPVMLGGFAAKHRAALVQPATVDQPAEPTMPHGTLKRLGIAVGDRATFALYNHIAGDYSTVTGVVERGDGDASRLLYVRTDDGKRREIGGFSSRVFGERVEQPADPTERPGPKTERKARAARAAKTEQPADKPARVGGRNPETDTKRMVEIRGSLRAMTHDYHREHPTEPFTAEALKKTFGAKWAGPIRIHQRNLAEAGVLVRVGDSKPETYVWNAEQPADDK